MRSRAAPLVCLCLLLGACTRARSRPGELRINLETEPPTLDWNLATDGVSIIAIEQLMRGLTRLDSELRPEPDLAESWAVSDEGRTYTFKLRPGVLWSDGVPLRAQHFVDSWRRLLDPKTAAEYAYFLFGIHNARAFNSGKVSDFGAVGVRAPDDRTLVVELDAPLVYFPALVNFMVTFPLRADLVARYGERWTDPGNLVTLGPFVLEEWRHEYRLVLRANERYWGGRPPLDRITAFMVQEGSTALVLFEQGLLDLVRIPPLEIRRYTNRPEYLRRPLLRGYYYGFNVRKPPFDDARVRRAFALAIDRSKFPELLRGGEQPWPSWIPPGMPDANPGLGLGFDPERARALLKEAGVDPARLPPVRIVYNNDQTHKLVAELVQAFWHDHLGVRVELQNREWKVFLKEVETDTPPVFRLGWGADFPDPDNFMNLFTSYSENNHTGWANPRYDALVERAAREADPGERQQLYDQAQRLLLEEDVPIVPLFVTSANFAVQPRVKGFVPSPMDLFFFEQVRAE
ncbi:MAG TPA: peptide ABC transporter substrate-binding protein [Myxococcota bacterium]|nr:peptide ABC transporter substrate-binding protein [Myxococcota bacterium]